MQQEKDQVDRDVHQQLSSSSKRAIIPPMLNLTQHDLAFFYKQLFPYDAIVRWLCYLNDSDKERSLLNDPHFFSKREISFTGYKYPAHPSKEEYYVRFQSFPNSLSLQREMNQRKPHKLDIGAVYNTSVKLRDSTTKPFKPVQKELVFDIDMDDYNDIRTCCEDKVVCSKCWKFITLAIRLLQRTLAEDFGFRHVLFVFSGRRGVHCWVCDAGARGLQSDGRAAIADYMSLITGSAKQEKKISLKHGKLHPMIERAFEQSLEYFPTLLHEQDFFHPTSKHLKTLLEFLPNTSLRGEVNVRAEFEFFLEKYNDKTHYYKSPEGSERIWKELWHLAGEKPTRWLKEIVFQFSYPRLDINVSKDMGHLLKSPFCVHHSTGRVCVPIDPETADEFDPTQVPTVELLRKQYAALSEANPEGEVLKNAVWKTSMRKYIKFFETKFLKALYAHVKSEQDDLLKFLHPNDDW